MSKFPLPFVFALDDNWEQSSRWIDRLNGQIWGFKVGSILFTQKGPEVIHYIKSKSLNVFLDLKFHDIPNTVSGAVQAAFNLGVDWVTLHSLGGKEMLTAAAAHQTPEKRVLAVTVLTSHDQSSLSEVGITEAVEFEALRLARLSVESGLNSIVCSPHEVKSLKTEFPDLTLITPGVRSGVSKGDQKRTATIREALSWGQTTSSLEEN